MLAFFYTCIFVCAAWLPFVWYQREIHGVVNVTHCALTLFNAVNLLICLWENALFIHRKKVRRVYLEFKMHSTADSGPFANSRILRLGQKLQLS